MNDCAGLRQDDGREMFMSAVVSASFNPELDLVIERELAASRDRVWRALVEPELVKQWFCPKPWIVAECRIDLRVGGEFHTVMQSPEGQRFPGSSCILEVVPEQRLIWSAALKPGFRPTPKTLPEGSKECDAIAMTCVITLQSTGNGTRYTALVLHGDSQQRKMHEDMGFHEGWGICAQQLGEVAEKL